MVGPVKMNEEMLYADIDLSLIPACKWMFDVTAHYARPDVFGFTVNRGPNPMMQTRDSRVDCKADS